MNLVNVDFPETSFLSCLFIYRGEVGEGGGGGTRRSGFSLMKVMF